MKLLKKVRLSAKALYLIDMIKLIEELKEIDVHGEKAIRPGFVDRYAEVVSNVNERDKTEKILNKTIKKLSDKLVKRGFFSSLF